MTERIDPADLQATEKFYDRISRAYDLLSDASEQEAREKGLELLAVQAGERVLEIGFGTGHVLASLARAVEGAGRVTGIDISTGMRDVALGRLRRAGLDQWVDLRVGAVPPVPYDDSVFDAAHMSFTLELFPAEVVPVLLKEVHRVLRPGGRLGVVAMARHPDEPDSLMERAYKWMHRNFPHIVDCRPIDVNGLLSRSGFRVEREADLTIWTLAVKAVVASTAATE